MSSAVRERTLPCGDLAVAEQLAGARPAAAASPPGRCGSPLDPPSRASPNRGMHPNRGVHPNAPAFPSAHRTLEPNTQRPSRRPQPSRGAARPTLRNFWHGSGAATQPRFLLDTQPCEKRLPRGRARVAGRAAPHRARSHPASLSPPAPAPRTRPTPAPAAASTGAPPASASAESFPPRPVTPV